MPFYHVQEQHPPPVWEDTQATSTWQEKLQRQNVHQVQINFAEAAAAASSHPIRFDPYKKKPQATSSPSTATNSLGESELKQSFSTSFKPPNISNGFARTCDVQEVKATLAASQVTVAPKMDHWESLSTIESIFRPFDNSADDNYFVSDESVLDK